MPNLPLSVIEEVALRNVHVRDILELKRLADRHNVVNPRVESNLQSWTAEWLEANPNQAKLILARVAA